MFDRILSLVGGRAKPAGTPTDMLPPELQTLIGGARFLEREGADVNSPRILVQTARGSFWGHDAEQVRAWLAAGWPELTEAQRVRAAAMVTARIAEAQHEQTAAAAAMRGRSAWRDWKPLERL